MPTAAECLAEVKAAFDGSATDDEIFEALEEFGSVARAIFEQRPYANVQEELFGHAARAAKRARETVLLKRRAKADNALKENRLRAKLDQAAWEKDPNAAVEATNFGSFGFAPGGKQSVWRSGASLAKFWIGSLENAINKHELTPALAHGHLDAQIAEEMWQLGRTKGGKPGISGSKEAQLAAKIIHRLQEVQVSRLNRAGAFIRRLPGYIIRQSGDARKIKKAGFGGWYAKTWPRVDEMKTFNRLLASDEREAIYQQLWNDYSNGRHPTVLEDQPWGDPLPVGGSLAKRVSAHREIHFKTAKDWYANHTEFGNGTLIENVVRASITNGRAVALMETYGGSNPKAMHHRFVAEADARAAKIGANTSQARSRFSADTMWGIVSGESQRPSDATLARLGNGARSWQVASKMGSAVVSAYISDPALQFAEMSRHGVPFLRKAAQPWANVIKLAAESKEQRELANYLGAMRNGIFNEVWSRFDVGEGVPGMASWMAGKVMKYSGFNYETNAMEAGIVGVISHELADRSAAPHASLEPGYAKMLAAYGIGAKEWPMLAGAVREIDGVPHIVPQELKLEPFGNLSTAAGRRAARRQRDELAGKLMSFIDDRRAASINEPGGRTKAILHGNDNPGTWRGEFWKAFALFKSFPTEMLVRTWGERAAEGEYVRLAGLVLTLTVLGTVTNTVRDATKGIAPPDPEKMNAAAMGQTFARGLLAGGGASIMGDLVLGEWDRYGRNVLAQQAGPLLGTIGDTVALGSATWKYAGKGATGNLEDGDTADLGARAFKLAYQNAPGANIWYLRTVFDYLLLYPMQEWLNPGYLRRMERNRERDTGQQFMLSPSQHRAW